MKRNNLLEGYASHLALSPDYRVLRRLKLPDVEAAGLSLDGTFHGVVVDCETDGLDFATNEAVELALHEFLFRAPKDGDATFARFYPPIRMLQEPKRPMPPEMTAIHGLSDADLAGQAFDQEAIAEIVGGAALVIAHNAAFDRPMLEKVSPIFAAARWACSLEQVPWKRHGFSSGSLENICTKLGAFYDAHQATNDCAAVLFALSHVVGDKTGLQHIIEASRRKSLKVLAYEAPYDSKDRLKARGYRWNDGSGGYPKCWHKEIPMEDGPAEESWLSAHVYQYRRPPAYELRTVTAKDRFTVRG